MQWCFVLDALMLVCFEKGADILRQGVDTIKVIFFYKWMNLKLFQVTYYNTLFSSSSVNIYCEFRYH